MTHPSLPTWPHTESGFRRSETTAVVGYGDAAWESAAEAVLRWEVKTQSGFSVDLVGVVQEGQRVNVKVKVLAFTVVEPVEVVEVVRLPKLSGFSYRTLPGHPVNGEEAFIVHRNGDEVVLTVRSLTRAAKQQPWRSLFPVLLIAQQFVRRRYRRALQPNRLSCKRRGEAEA